MAAFPPPPAVPGSLHDLRDKLRGEVGILEESLATLQAWVEALERDRIEMVVGAVVPEGAPPPPYPDDATFDAAWLPLATALLPSIAAENDKNDPASLYHRVQTGLQIKR